MLSSHVSDPAIIPSEHIGVQKLGAVGDCSEHLKPVSIIQSAEQPSPLLLFPSSHFSKGILVPSPQIGVQIENVLVEFFEQVYPVSIKHVALHPSPFTVL